MIKAVVVSTNFRNTENWLPVFEKIIEDGGRCKAIYFPWNGDDSFHRMNDLKIPVQCKLEISALSNAALPEEELDRVLAQHIGEEDVVFLCDMQSYPSSKIHEILLKRERRPLVVGLQHGLFQSWWLYNRNFCADYLLSFNKRAASSIFPAYRKRVFPVGLPKLDRLANLATADGGYVLYLAQKYPEAHLVEGVLQEMEKEFPIPVFVRNHPQYPEEVRHAGAREMPLINGKPIADCSYEEQIANASWVLTSHSTGGLEALYLKKSVVLLPNHGLTAWPDYPGVAFDISAKAIFHALGRTKAYRQDVDLFLKNAMESKYRSHTKSALSTIYALVEKARSF
ncbi:MAG: hypothetical protein WBC18_06385 [Ottowia sp.]